MRRLDSAFDIRKISENFILAAIVLVAVQTIIEEYSRYARWSVGTRNILLVCGFCFDLLFTIEFSIRSYLSGRMGRFKSYIRYERGWIDFLSSIPLLVLDSGPSLFFLVSADAHTGTGAIALLNMLKVVKAVRITEILRFFRILKIFGKIHNTDSKMALHHTSVITTTAVFTVVAVLLVFNLISGRSASDLSEERTAGYTELIDGLKRISDMNGLGFRETSESLLLKDRNVLKIIYTDGTVIEKIPSTEFSMYYNEEDYISVTGKGCTLLVSISDIIRPIALERIRNFTIIVFIVLSFLIFYTRHFAQNISDAAQVLNLGFRKKDYNLMVKIPPEKSDHEIFRLARFYNDAYLPAKMKKNKSKDLPGSSGLSVKDLEDFR